MKKKSKIRTLEELRVTEIKKDLFVSDKPIFRFDTQGDILLTDLSVGSLIYSGKTIEGPAAGFHSAVCCIWKGIEEINEYKAVLLKHHKKKVIEAQDG